MNVGDTVVIDSTESAFVRQWKENAHMQPGVIFSVSVEGGAETWFSVRFPNGYMNNYGETHLRLAGPAPLSSDEYEDIMAGQEIYSELEGSNG